jgi:hypothetical protein
MNKQILHSNTILSMSITLSCSNAGQDWLRGTEVAKVRYFYTTAISFLAQYTYCCEIFMSHSLAPSILPKENIAHLNTVFLITLIHTIDENLRREKKCFFNYIDSHYR